MLGILVTFHDLSQGAELSASAVMLGLALALKATAALLVAIPATLIYNGLVRRVDVLTGALAQPTGRDMKLMSTMNVIPFIDIMLVLLAIVLTTATFVAQARSPSPSQRLPKRSRCNCINRSN